MCQGSALNTRPTRRGTVRHQDFQTMLGLTLRRRGEGSGRDHEDWGSARALTVRTNGPQNYDDVTMKTT
jgi:hypothetical protein